MDILIGYCGLDCGSCEAREATIKNDDKMRAKVAKEWSELNGVTITPEMINCTGCRALGPKTPYCESLCNIKICASKKGYETCRDCKVKAQCDKLSPIASNNNTARENLDIH